MTQQNVRAIEIQQGIEDWIGLDVELTEEDVRKIAWAFAMDEDLHKKFNTLVRDTHFDYWMERKEDTK